MLLIDMGNVTVALGKIKMLTDNGGLAMFGIYRKQPRNRKKVDISIEKCEKISFYCIFGVYHVQFDIFKGNDKY